MGFTFGFCVIFLVMILDRIRLNDFAKRFHAFILQHFGEKLGLTVIEHISTVLFATIRVAPLVVAFESSSLEFLPHDYAIEVFSNISFDGTQFDYASSILKLLFNFGLKIFIYGIVLKAIFSVSQENLRTTTQKFRQQRLCPICRDEVSALPQRICCVQQHQIHRECLNGLIIHQCEMVLKVPSTSSLIKCPTCADVFTQEKLMNAGGGASKRARSLLANVAAADLALSKLNEEEQLKTGQNDCYMCPKCKYGPIAHTACADLTAHHGRHGVSNQCPKCSFFADKISKWQKWNGGEVGESSKPKKDAISSDEAQVMDFCAVPLEVARDMLRRDCNVHRVVTNFVQNAPIAHAARSSCRI